MLFRSRISKIYHNNGNGTFTDINANLIGVHDSSVAWGDYENDGNLDILLKGLTVSSDGISKIYHNNGNGTFTDININLPAVEESSVAWGNYDNDCDLDILLTGTTISMVISKIYRNNGNGTFTDILANLMPVHHSSVAWGDYDNDGDLDILLMGRVGGFGVGSISKVYRNDGNNTFTNINANLIGVHDGSVAW